MQQTRSFSGEDKDQILLANPFCKVYALGTHRCGKFGLISNTNTADMAKDRHFPIFFESMLKKKIW